MKQSRTLWLLLALGASACITRPVDEAKAGLFEQVPLPFLQSTDTEVDLLFVVDNSESMSHEQANIARNFPKLIEALRSHELGPDGSGRPCTPTDRSGCQIPDLHIGVVSSDLGVGSFAGIAGLDSCSAQGDRGILQHQARDPTCTPPKDRYISYRDGETNIPGESSDPIEHLKQAFGCIARLGTGGCGFEQPLEAARLALDTRNPGFLRESALLAVVLITDEDDCSARDSQLFDPRQTSIDSPLGPLHSFRCFEHGFECDINDRTKVGPRRDCRPAGRFLWDLSRYVDFFRRLKPAHRLVFAAISGPTGRVAVGRDGNNPTLEPSCQSSAGVAAPALRIEQVVEAFGDDGHFSSICAGDFGPAMSAIGKKLQGRIGDQCIDNTLLTAEGTVACEAGDSFSPGKACKASCLERVSCELIEGRSTDLAHGKKVDRCPARLWYPQDWQQQRDCGADCPCWRLVRKPGKCGGADSSPYALDILRDADPPKGTLAQMRCLVAPLRWGDARLSSHEACR